MKKIIVLEKITKILETIAAEPDGCTMNQVVKSTSLQPSTVYNLIQNLVHLRYLEKDANSKKYRTGRKILELFGPISKRKIITKISEPFILELAEKVQESIVLAVFHNGERYVVATTEYKNHILNVNLDLFEKSTCYETATGRVLLSYLPQVELRKYVEKHGYPLEKWDNIRSFKQLTKVTKKIREKRLAMKKGNGLVAIAAPVTARDNTVWAAIGIYLPEIRFGNDKKSQILSEIKVASEKISSKLAGEIYEKID